MIDCCLLKRNEVFNLCRHYPSISLKSRTLAQPKHPSLSAGGCLKGKAVFNDTAIPVT